MYHDYLLTLAEQGNVEAFWALTEQQLNMVFNKIWFLSGSAGQAKWIIKRGLARAWVQIQKRQGLKSFPAFLSRAVMDVALMRLNSPVRQELCSSLDVELQADGGWLVAWFRRLDQLQRRVVMLRYFEGLAIKEISSMLGKSEERVASTLIEALQSFEIPSGRAADDLGL